MRNELAFFQGYALTNYTDRDRHSLQSCAMAWISFVNSACDTCCNDWDLLVLPQIIVVGAEQGLDRFFLLHKSIIIII